LKNNSVKTLFTTKTLIHLNSSKIYTFIVTVQIYMLHHETTYFMKWALFREMASHELRNQQHIWRRIIFFLTVMILNHELVDVQ